MHKYAFGFVTEGNSEEKFDLHSSTGVLTLRKQLHYEQTRLYELTVTVNGNSMSIAIISLY